MHQHADRILVFGVRFMSSEVMAAGSVVRADRLALLVSSVVRVLQLNRAPELELEPAAFSERSAEQDDQAEHHADSDEDPADSLLRHEQDRAEHYRPQDDGPDTACRDVEVVAHDGNSLVGRHKGFRGSSECVALVSLLGRTFTARELAIGVAQTHSTVRGGSWSRKGL